MKSNFELTPADWATLRRLLGEALDRPSAERATWVDDLAPDFEAFKPRLRELLAHAASGTGALAPDTLPKIETAQFLADGRTHADRLDAGSVIGPYRLVRLLGEGGMGEVWLGERTDMLHKRQVALKLPHLLTGRAALAERMAREREILAGLEHPNIARLYDAGITADGQPYLALEYVEGERIDAYCQRKQLDVPARLRLFLQVARAVAHAHANLVVHRDLKPTNILVTGAGEVKLLDFGIAKLLEDGRAQETELTQLAGRALTPDYAAPEQILGEPIGTAADVYALAVVLFELLTGGRPYQLKRGSRAALEEAIVQAEPARPSSVVSDPRLRRRLQGDLDTIVLKAMKKTPAERYGTVFALAEDLERYLDGRPVLAQADSGFYRMRKFVARNRLAVGAAAAIFVAIVAGAGVSMWQAQVALAEKHRAEAVKDFIASMFREASPFARTAQKPVTAADLLRNARDRIDGELRNDPMTRAELLTIVGSSLAGLGEFQRSAEVLAEATAAWRGLVPEDDARALRAQTQLADAEHQIGKRDEAGARLAQIGALLQRAGQTESDTFVRVKILEATFEANDGRMGSAKHLASARAAVETAERVFGERNDETITAYQVLGTAYRWRGEVEQALTYSEKAYRAALAHFGDDGRHPRTIILENELGRALAAAGKLGDAVSHMKAAADRAGDVFGANHVMVQHFRGTLAMTQLDYGEVKAAIANLARAVAQDVGDAKLSPAYHASQSVAQGRVLLAARLPQEALKHYDAALAAFEQAGVRNTLYLTAEAEHALALAESGQTEEAARRLERMVEQRRKANSSELQMTLRFLGYTRYRQDRHDEALALLNEARQILEKFTAKPAARAAFKLALADTLRDIGHVHLARDRAIDSLREFDAARARYGDLQAMLSPGHVEALVGSARARLLLDRTTEALPLLEQADAFWRDFDAGNRWAGETAFWLGRCYSALGRTGDARHAYARAAKILAGSTIPRDRELVQIARRG
jgi:eukaryotic-like serine/threonine-protein kinase